MGLRAGCHKVPEHASGAHRKLARLVGREGKKERKRKKRKKRKRGKGRNEGRKEGRKEGGKEERNSIALTLYFILYTSYFAYSRTLLIWR